MEKQLTIYNVNTNYLVSAFAIKKNHLPS